MNILPPNASPTEKALSNITTALFNTPFTLPILYQPATCPTALLPFLAWSVSVDNWNNSLTENQKRQAIATSIDVHRKKGTRGAMNTALNALGFDIEFREWFEQKPHANPFTFTIKINVNDKPFIEKDLNQLEQTITATKNVRSHLHAITVFTKTNASNTLNTFNKMGSTTFIAPFIEQKIKSVSAYAQGSSLHLISKTLIHPWIASTISTSCNDVRYISLKILSKTIIQGTQP